MDVALHSPRRAYYAVVGRPFVLYFDNLVHDSSSSELTFEILSEVVGVHYADRWAATPTTAGTKTLRIRVRKGLAAYTDLTFPLVVSADCGAYAGKILIVGDSNTAAGVIPADLAALLPAATFLGTQGVAVHHEGISGKYYGWFADEAASPMTSGAGVTDIPAYLAAIGDTPDVVVWLMFTNRVFFLKGLTTGGDISQEIDNYEFVPMRELIAAWTAAAPATKHAVGFSLPHNSRQAAYDASYPPPTYTDLDRSRWRWRWNQWLTNSLLMREVRDSGATFAPLHVHDSIDQTGGYDATNAVHANATGYAQEVEVIYAWICSL